MVVALVLLLGAGSVHAVAARSDPVDQALIDCAPKTFDAALGCLDGNLPATVKQELATRDGPIRAHFGLGLFIRNEWGLWKGGPLAQSMRVLGFTHPDDMSATIIEAYAAQVRRQPYDIQAKAAYYRDYWKRAPGGEVAMNKACSTRTPVPVGDGTVAVCEWSRALKNNVMHFDKVGDVHPYGLN